MKITWNDKDPLYRQLHDKLVELIVDGVLPEGAPLPSIREISSQHQINHITVAKAIQMLVDEGFVEKRRGVGMYVAQGATMALTDSEKQKFLRHEWPQICKKIQRLGLSADVLLKGIKEGEKVMSAVIKAQHLQKSFGKTKVLDDLSMTIEKGSITGLIGPNGAGKTTTLKAILGLTSFDGELDVLGIDPRQGRHRLMEKVCFIADVGVLPRWMRVGEAVAYVEGVHPRFSREKALRLIAETDMSMKAKIGELSKGMVTQLHLALILAIDAELLVLDEPTLGLDILYQKAFFDRILNDYYDQNTTIVISTHQVEEVRSVLTHLLFIDSGKIVLNTSMDALAETWCAVTVAPDKYEQAEALHPIHVTNVLGAKTMLFENVAAQDLEILGSVYAPTISDLFHAKMQKAGRIVQ